MHKKKDLREVVLYLLFGGLTTVVSVAVYWVFNVGLSVNELIANGIAWILAVLFAFFTNRVWVFAAPVGTRLDFIRQMFAFFGGRIVTLLVEEVILAVFVTWLAFPGMAVKLVAQAVVVVLNYIISKLFVFRKAQPTVPSQRPEAEEMRSSSRS